MAHVRLPLQWVDYGMAITCCRVTFPWMMSMSAVSAYDAAAYYSDVRDSRRSPRSPPAASGVRAA